MHILHHVGRGLRDFVPVYSNWMYPYERFNSWMCRRALNRRRPEATIVETYRVSAISCQDVSKLRAYKLQGEEDMQLLCTRPSKNANAINF